MIQIIPNNTNKILLNSNDANVSTIKSSLVIELDNINSGAFRMFDSNKCIDRFVRIDMLRMQPRLPIKIVHNIICLRVLPLEILTTNAPTIGARAIHQAQ